LRQAFLPDCQRALVHPFRLYVLALQLIEVGYQVEGGGVVRVIGAEPRLDGGFELLRFDQRGGIVAGIGKFVSSLQNRIKIGLRAGRRKPDDDDGEPDRNERRQAAHGFLPARWNGAQSLVVAIVVQIQ